MLTMEKTDDSQTKDNFLTIDPEMVYIIIHRGKAREGRYFRSVTLTLPNGTTSEMFARPEAVEFLQDLTDQKEQYQPHQRGRAL